MGAGGGGRNEITDLGYNEPFSLIPSAYFFLDIDLHIQRYVTPPISLLCNKVSVVDKEIPSVL